MNGMNASFYNGKRVHRKTDQFIIKNNQPVSVKKVSSGIGSNPIVGKEGIKIQLGSKQASLSENTAYTYPKPGFQFEKVQRAPSRDNIDPMKNSKKTENDVGNFTPKPEINLDDYIKKSRYEDLGKKYDQLSQKYEELRRKNKQLETTHNQESKRVVELEGENKKLKERIRELEAQNKNLRQLQQRQNARDHSTEAIEETKMDDNDLRSLRLAMRMEAENILLSQLSQIAALQMIYERPERTNEGIDFDNPHNINPDNMTYEELLQLEERMGKVSKGLSVEQIKAIPKRTYHKHAGKPDETCSICFVEVETGSKVRKLPCRHEYHSKCIKQWLLNEKTCPICKTEVTVSQ